MTRFFQIPAPCVDHRFCKNRSDRICRLRFVSVNFCPLKCGSCSPQGATLAPSKACQSSALNDGQIEKFKSASEKFAWGLYRHARNLEKGNMVFSPASISIAVGMALAGARGKTRDEMKQVLAKGMKDEDVS